MPPYITYYSVAILLLNILSLHIIADIVSIIFIILLLLSFHYYYACLFHYFYLLVIIITYCYILAYYYYIHYLLLESILLLHAMLVTYIPYTYTYMFFVDSFSCYEAPCCHWYCHMMIPFVDILILLLLFQRSAVTYAAFLSHNIAAIASHYAILRAIDCQPLLLPLLLLICLLAMLPY